MHCDLLPPSFQSFCILVYLAQISQKNVSIPFLVSTASGTNKGLL